MTFFDQLKAAVDENNYSDDQILNATKKQVANLLGVSETAIRDGVLKAVKYNLIKDRAERLMQEAVQGLKDQLIGGGRVWLNSNFPNNEIVKNTRHRSVTIYFDGFPEETE